MQLCLPKPFRKEFLKGCHDNVGHLGLERTLDLLRDRFYWPHLLDDAKDHVGTEDAKLQSLSNRELQCNPIMLMHPWN